MSAATMLLAWERLNTRVRPSASQSSTATSPARTCGGEGSGREGRL